MIDAEATKRFMAAPWLAEIDSQTKKAILGALVEARAPTGATLLEQGQPNDHLTFLIEGTADIVRVNGNGRRDVITHLTAPAMFGTTSFFQPRPPTVRVQATSEVWMLSLYHPAHEALRAENPPRRGSTCPCSRASAVGAFRSDRNAFHRIYVPAFRRAPEKKRMGGFSCPAFRRVTGNLIEAVGL